MKPQPHRLCHWISLIFCIGSALLLCEPVSAQSEPLEQIITLPGKQGSIYQLLDIVARKSGYLFVYDSDKIDNEKQIRFPKGKYTLRQAVYQIIGNQSFELRVMGNHILIASAPTPLVQTLFPDTLISTADAEPVQHILTGKITDKENREPLEAATVGILNHSIGTITNADGEFRLIIPDSLKDTTLCFSHIGYQPQQFTANWLTGQYITLALESQTIPIQEVIIRMVNPVRLLKEVEARRNDNYMQQAVHLTSFYREGVYYNQEFVNLTEAVMKIHKSGYDTQVADQVKLLKMRKITNTEVKDTLIAKMKSGINASLLLDLIKHMPDFLQPEENNLYVYASTDLTVLNDRLAQVVYFEQRDAITEPLYKGELYIDTENHALLQGTFELNPEYIHKAANMLIERKSRDLSIIPEKAVYTVSYKSLNNRYYINHVRGDLHFKMKKRKQLFAGKPLHIWFEMATGKIETDHIRRFARNELIPTRTIFSETRFSYDAKFWDDFNYILPETRLSDAISRITAKIEENEE